MVINNVKIKPEEVVWAEADRNYTIVVLTTGKKIVSCHTLGMVYQHLGLYRVHRSFAVNPSQVGEMTEDGLLMKSGEIVPVSRKRVKEVENKFSVQ